MLVGRRPEMEALVDLLSGARSGRSGALVIRGEAGIGKSALLREAARLAEGMTVLRVAGVESESELAFAGLHQLLRPAFDRIDRLPPPQAAALRAAFALSGDTPGDRFRVAVAVLGLLCEVADDRPLLCLVDDAHWLDHASSEALLFAARRLTAEALAIVFAARDDLTGSFPAPGLPELRPGGLEDGAARLLAASRLTGDSSSATVSWLLANARGNPLALIELAAARPVPGAAPPTTSVEQAYVERIRRLPEAVRQLLLIAAAEETGDRGVIARAAAEEGLDPEALGVAEAEGLVEVGPDLVAFRHPLVRSAAYRGGGFADRERAHRLLAGVLTSRADADRRAWHRAASTVGADEEVAAELEGSAIRAQQRGGHGAAATALVRAAELSANEGEQSRRLKLAAVEANLAGQYERTVALCELGMSRDVDPASRADLALLRGSADIWHGRPADICDRLAAAAEAVIEVDSVRALQLAGAAAEAGALAGDGPRIERASRVAAAATIDPDDPRQALLALVPAGGALLFAGDIAASAPLFRRAAALTIGAVADTPRDIVWRAITALLAGDYERARGSYRAAAGRARELGALGTLWYVLTGQAIAAHYFADVREAAEAANEAARLAADLGAERYATHAVSVLGWVAAIKGDEDELERCAARVALDANRGVALPPATLAWGRALLALARGRNDAALRELTAVAGFRAGFGHPMLAAASAADLVEAAVRSGQESVAAQPIALLRLWVEHASPADRRPVLERALALAAGTAAEAGVRFEEALRLHQAGGTPFHLARTELLYGEHLRRERKKGEARLHLRNAAVRFSQLGATPWADRATAELRAAGEVAGKRDPHAVTQLTAQELQIARLVGGGGSNKDIAAQLFLSPRTVEYHVSKVFQKLGIASRAELIRQGVE